MKLLRKMDKTLLIMIIIYSLFGLLMIFSASSASTVLRYNTSSMHFFIRQLATLIIGYIGGFIILFIPTKCYKVIVYLMTAFFILLLAGVLIYGKVVGGALSWIDIGPVNVQPTEFCKTMIILFMAFYYSSIQKVSNNLSLYFFPAGIAVLMVILILMQPDFGSGIILTIIAIACFLQVPLVKKNKKIIRKILLLGVIATALICICFPKYVFTPKRISRLTQFANPCKRYQDESGYQVCNGFIAIANGGLFGSGLGQSTQKFLYLPESHTDFIFPIICEECGAIIGIVVIIGYGVMLFRILRIAQKSSNVRNKIISYGTFWFFTLHIIINLLGVLALMPLTGVPLPFLSYGGSFTLNAIVLVFLTERISIENKIYNENYIISKIV